MNRCIFCREDRKISKEHVISEPIAKVFRLDRGSDRVASLDPRRMEMGPAISHDQRRVGLPCEPCNNGWMSQLEVQASLVFRDWCHRNRPISADAVEEIQRWALKMYIVLSAVHGGTRKFANEGATTWAVVPEATRGPMVRLADASMLEGVAIGAFRTTGDAYVFEAFGNPRVQPRGPQFPNSRSAGVSVLNLGKLQLWTVVATIPGAIAHLPDGATPLSPHLRFASLQLAQQTPDLSSALVENPDLTVDQLFPQL